MPANLSSLLKNSIRPVPSSISVSSRTSNTVLGASDKSYLIDITSGTFTQTFTTAVTLGNGWFCYIRNSGTGDITLDPDASELIDGLASYIMYPGEIRMIACTGTAFTSIVMKSFYKTFTASGTFTTPPGYTAFGGLLWGGGGGGGFQSDNSTVGYPGHGGGGACNVIDLASSVLTATVEVTIASGGVGGTSNAIHGETGGYSKFHTLYAYGGAGGRSAQVGYNMQGGGGGIRNSGVSTGAGDPVDTPFGGGGTSTYGSNNIGNGTYGGGRGGWPSIYGGGGGGSTSQYGGAGGVGGTNGTPGGNGVAPAGGGGLGVNNNAPGNGARGELRIWGRI